MKRRIRPAYARVDPAHLFDGLFVPTNGKKRDRLYVEPRPFDDVLISFQGFEQLGADDQSILLAISAQLSIDGLMIYEEPRGEISHQLKLDLQIAGDASAPLATKKTSLRSLMIDAGYRSDRDTKQAHESLNRLRSVQIREQNGKTGWDRVSNLISTSFNKLTGETYVAANPRLTAAVFKGQHVKISLFERNELETEVAKLMHCWLCSNVRLGKALGNGNGAEIDTLAPHVWGSSHEGESAKIRSVRRSKLRDALIEIEDKTKDLHDDYGWSIDVSGSGLVLVSRPKELPFVEQVCETPSHLRVKW